MIFSVVAIIVMSEIVVVVVVVDRGEVVFVAVGVWNDSGAPRTLIGGGRCPTKPVGRQRDRAGGDDHHGDNQEAEEWPWKATNEGSMRFDHFSATI